MDAARACSTRVAAFIRAGQDVVLSFEGFHGASSSFFNTFWLTLIEAIGLGGLGRLEMQMTSRILADVSERSRAAAIARARETQEARSNSVR